MFYLPGLLSRTGVCPQMDSNLQRKDNRLNFFGQAIVFPGEEVADCFTSDCTFDGDCEGDKKCCRNNCGAAVCSPVGKFGYTKFRWGYSSLLD